MWTHLVEDQILASEQRGCSSLKHECTEKPMVSPIQAKAQAGRQAAASHLLYIAWIDFR